MFDRANEQERLFGLRLDGVWMHVGTPDAIAAAEAAFLESVARAGIARSEDRVCQKRSKALSDGLRFMLS